MYGAGCKYGCGYTLCRDKRQKTGLEHARVLIHQPLISGNMFGPASDIQIQAEEMLRIRDNLNQILADHTGPDSENFEDTDGTSSCRRRKPGSMELSTKFPGKVDDIFFDFHL